MRTIAITLGWAYLVVILLLVATIRLVGEESWLVAAALYVPRLPLLLPLVVTLPIALVLRRPGLLGAQLAAAILVLGPIAGLRVRGCVAPPAPSVGTIRVISWNTWFGKGEMAAIRAQLEAAHPDVIALQAARPRVADLVRAAFPGWALHLTGELLIASRYPISACEEPAEIQVGSRQVPSQWLRCTLATPAGPLDVVSAHPWSPRHSLEDLRDGSSDADQRIESNVGARRAQVHAAARAARAARHPVLVAGDLNLPEGSAILREELGALRDGWDQLGCGFGFTFPVLARRPWLPSFLRLDRVLAGAGVRFHDFQVGPPRGSDHRWVLVVLSLDTEGP